MISLVFGKSPNTAEPQPTYKVIGSIGFVVQIPLAGQL